MNIFLCNNFFSHFSKGFSPLATSLGVGALMLVFADPSLATCLTNTSDFGFVPGDSVQQVTDEYPEVFWKLGQHTAENLRITVTDSEARELYFWDYRLASTVPETLPKVELMSVQPPHRLATTALAVGETQVWELTLICDEGDRRQNITITQEIQRVPEDELLKSSIDTLPAPEKVETYLAQGLVHNALSEFINWQTHQDTMPNPLSLYERWVDFQEKAGIMESD